MVVSFSKRSLILTVFIMATAALAVWGLLKAFSISLPRVLGLASGREAALNGTKAFYSIDYQTGSDQWTAGLCALSTDAACSYYQDTVAPFLWLSFMPAQTMITADVKDAQLLAEAIPGEPDGVALQIWQVGVHLSAPWPQGHGLTDFPAQVLVRREDNGWKFERFLLKEELVDPQVEVK